LIGFIIVSDIFLNKCLIILKMEEYIAMIFDHSGVKSGVHTSPIEETFEYKFLAENDETAFRFVSQELWDRAFDSNKALIPNPNDNRCYQRLESLMEGNRIVDYSKFKAIKRLGIDEEGKLYVEALALSRIVWTSF